MVQAPSPQRLSETLLWLCNIHSPTGEEKTLCQAVVERLAKIPLAAPLRRYGDSLVVPLTRGYGTHVVLAGHLDVVRTTHDGPARIEGDRLYGPGAADMKSGLTLMLALAEQLERPKLDLTLVFYAAEEGPFAENELGLVLTAEPDLKRADLAVALEPSDNKLQLGCGGSIHATVRFTGRTAHSARPWQGDNAIHKAGHLLTRLEQLQPAPQLVDGLTWQNVLSATMAQGGRARNIVPDNFELNLNYRFGPLTQIAEAQAHIVNFVEGSAEVEFIDISPAAPPFRSHPLVKELIASGVTAVEPKQAWTDVGRLAAAGIAAVNFGPGVQAQAHQRNEWTSIQQLAEGYAILERWFTRIAG